METHSKVSVKENVAHFIQRFRIFLISFLVLVAVGIIVAAVYQGISSASSNAVTKVTEELETAYENLKSAKDDTEKLAFQKIFDEVSQKIEKSYSGSFAQQRCDYYQGNLKFAAKDFGGAEIAFAKAAKDLNSSYLAPIALMNAAISAEENLNTPKTVSYLTDLVQNYAKTSALAYRAQFNLGRLAESQKQWAVAKDVYQKLLDSFGSSSWTKLARDRIIYLKAQGLI